MHYQFDNYVPFVGNVRTDNAGEYVGYKSEFAIYLREYGIAHEFSAQHVHQQNGVAEKKNLAIANGLRSALAQANLPRSFGGFAATAFVHAENHCPHIGGGLSPMGKWPTAGTIFPTVDILRTFGCVVYSHLEKQQRRDGDKLARLADKGIVVGYAPYMHAWKVTFRAKTRRSTGAMSCSLRLCLALSTWK